ncbi:NAD-dependent epimerase/dehydratase family protein [Alteriqipengyuania sp.]|uniref:NAD-dependent epimerase/dehydratase family protein n=1 Tax=Alteriqipengyuania sp. TaxID=2800692 RepID=UPI0035122151
MMAQTILVTGGTGYIGGEVIDQLLAKGHTVHTTVRNVAKGEPRLRGRWAEAGERLKVFQADLMDDAGWAEASAGCDAIAHVASPFPMEVPNDPQVLIKPAREGTLRALKFAHEAGVQRFVQTSSAAAIAYGHRGQENFDESDWTNLDADPPPYIQSKTIAERAARDWVAETAPGMVFCSVNPVGVFGPVYDADLSTSVELVQKVIDGSIPMAPNMGIGVVDVRDVAKIHVLALEAPAETVRNGRFAASAQFMWIMEMADMLRQRAPDLAKKTPTRRMPDFLVRILALFMPEMKQVKGELGNVRDVSGAHAEKTFGFTYIPAGQTIEDTARSLIEKGIVKF